MTTFTTPPDCSESPWVNPIDGKTYVCKDGMWLVQSNNSGGGNGGGSGGGSGGGVGDSSGLIVFPCERKPVELKWYYAHSQQNTYQVQAGGVGAYASPSSNSTGSSYLCTNYSMDAKGQTDMQDYVNKRIVPANGTKYVGGVYFQLVDKATEEIVYGDAYCHTYGCGFKSDSGYRCLSWYTGKSSPNAYGRDEFNRLMSLWYDKENKFIRWTMGPDDDGTHVATGMKQWYCGNTYGYVHKTPLLWDGYTNTFGNTDPSTHYLPPSAEE